MSKKLKRLLIKFTLLTSLYNAALGIWSGTIYLFMRHIQYTYADINVFLSVFWIVTFFLNCHQESWQINLEESMFLF